MGIDNTYCCFFSPLFKLQSATIYYNLSYSKAFFFDPFRNYYLLSFLILNFHF